MFVPEAIITSETCALPSRPTVRDRLREDTARVHRQLEQGTRLNQAIAQIPSRNLSPHELQSSREAYRALYHTFLTVALALERGFEQRLENNSEVVTALQRIALVPEQPLGSLLIEQDLREMKLPVPPADMLCDQLPQVVTVGEAVGLHYVRLGSRLGGTMIGKCVEMNLGSDTPRGFLTRYRGSVKSVVEEAFVKYDQLSCEEAAQAIRLARQTFQAILKWQQQIEQGLEIPNVQKRPDNLMARLLRWLQK